MILFKKISHLIIGLLLLGIGQKAFAEYDKSEFELRFLSVNEVEINLFIEATGFFEPDSMNSPAYLKQFLTQGNIINEENIMHGFKNRYECGENYIYFSSVLIALDTIKSISIKDLSNGTFMAEILSSVEIGDTTWFTKNPMNKIRLEGANYDYTIFIYENNTELKKLIKLFKSEYEKSSGAHEDNDEMGQRIREVVKQLNSYKVIVTSFGAGC